MNQREQDAFYVVWCPEGGSPTKQHYTQSAAETEANRLARDNRGRNFVVLMALNSRCVNDVVVTQFIPQVPF